MKTTTDRTNIAIVTGGTGGHIYPALALADCWKERDPNVSFTFIGNDDRMEADLIPERGYPFKALHTKGLAGSAFDKLKALYLSAAAVTKARAILKEIHPDLLIGFGGYVSGPVMMAAHSLHIPILVHEQNSIAGKANNLMKNKVDAIAVCYPNALDLFPKGKTRLVGNPRATLAARAKSDPSIFEALGIDPAKKTILIMMGSLGSGSINEMMQSALKQTDPDMQFVYVLGKDNEADRSRFEGMDNVFCVDFIDTMKIYGLIDGIICRAGATTLAEVTALGIPAVIIPSPFVANNHQYFNARQLSDNGAAVLLEEKDLNAQSLKSAIEKAFYDEENRRAMAKAAKAMGKPEAADAIIDWSKAIIERNQSRSDQKPGSGNDKGERKGSE